MIRHKRSPGHRPSSSAVEQLTSRPRTEHKGHRSLNVALRRVRAAQQVPSFT
ncbi:hypothetical protein [Paenibacillus dendritiformis]|uniref:hypothetical protein n=1 Tax=Paenibacillus dendritiformis TaxID=130049 RepID=UPI00387E086B